jgi:tryptophan halogenase
MKVAVMGGGTAGYMAAAHLSKFFPQLDLYHIYDPSLPTIGVGEGTLVGFTYWLRSITGLSYSELVKRCYITRKFGIRFENWGREYEKFFHHFYPIGKNNGYHISAAKIVEMLQEYVKATQIYKRIILVESDGVSVNIAFEDNSNLEVDLAIDARGFPKSLEENQVKLSLIPTNSALIRQKPVVDGEVGVVEIQIGDRTFQYQSATRSVARPHGWIFIIPLTNRTSYGYIYNNQINSVSDIEQDFDTFLEEEGITCAPGDKHLNFPNYTHRTFFDGALFKMGNAASFLEPLEATAIGVIHKQIATLSYWPIPLLLAQPEKRSKLNEHDLEVFNNHLFKFITKISLFVAWHYAKGSRFDTEFWRFAQGNFFTELDKIENQAIRSEFDKYLEAGSQMPHPFKNQEEFARDISVVLGDFGQFPPQSFAEMGYGIGYFS